MRHLGIVPPSRENSMDANQAITSLQPEHFTNVLLSEHVARLPSASQSKVLDVVRGDRVRVLSILALSAMSINPIIVRAIAHGWSQGQLERLQNSQW